MKELNDTEIKILHLLKNLDTVDKYVGNIRKKVKLEYHYVCKVLKQMNDDGLIKRITPPGTNKVFYELKKKGGEAIKE